MSSMDRAEAKRLAEEVRQGRKAAHRKHGARSIEAQAPISDRFMSILTEEVGEVATELNEHALGITTQEEALRCIRAELIDVLTVATAWVSAIDRLGEPRR